MDAARTKLTVNDIYHDSGIFLWNPGLPLNHNLSPDSIECFFYNITN